MAAIATSSCLSSYESKHDEGDNQHQEQEARAAAHVRPTVCLDGIYFHRHAGLVSVDRFVLGAVIGKDTLDILYQRYQFKITDEDSQPDYSFDVHKKHRVGYIGVHQLGE